MVTRRAKKAEFDRVYKMAHKLWPKYKKSEIFVPKHKFYVAEEDDRFVGFIMLNARRDYVPGSDSSPVGYIEGIFVEKEWRKKGVGRKLIKAAERWCQQKGLTELGSDVEPENQISQHFHIRNGFRREKLVLPYIKKVRPR